MTRLSIALVFAVAALSAAEISSTQSPDLTVHEWGTFTSVAGPDGSAVDWNAWGGKDDLPGFVHALPPVFCSKIALRGTVRMETPVLYFYTPVDVNARVNVDFPKGLITEWFPQADYKAYQKGLGDRVTRRLPENLDGIDLTLQSLTGAIEWSDIHLEPNTSPALPSTTVPSRYYAARTTDSVPITVGNDQEKFLFYRGVGRFPVPLAARVADDGSVAVENRGGDTVPSVILFQNRDGKVGFRNAGSIKTSAVLEPPSLDSSKTALRVELETALTAQGLFPKESQAMVETWRDSWFEEGTRLIYILPSRAVDTFLALHVDPAPSEIARVFVGRVELITPDMMRSVEIALASADFSGVVRYGRFAEPILACIVAENPGFQEQASRVLTKIKSLNGACR